MAGMDATFEKPWIGCKESNRVLNPGKASVSRCSLNNAIAKEDLPTMFINGQTIERGTL